MPPANPDTAFAASHSRRARKSALGSVFLSVLFCVAPSAPAEVLALNDGQIIETKGPWTIEGRRITYTALNGTFSALRVSLVDLEKSRALFEQRLNPPASVAPREKPKATVGLVVRQTDVARSRGKNKPKEQAVGSAVEPGSIGVSTWDEVVVAQGTKLAGTLQNATKNTHLGMKLNVSLIADNGDTLATLPANLLKNWLRPGTEMSFEVTFSDVFAFTDATFAVESTPLKAPENAEGTDTEQEAASDALPADDPPGR